MKLSIAFFSTCVLALASSESRQEPRDLLAQVLDRMTLIQAEMELFIRQFQRTLTGNARMSRLVGEKLPSVEEIETLTKQLLATDQMIKELGTGLVGRQMPGGMPSIPGLDQIMAMFGQLASQFQQVGGLLGGMTGSFTRQGNDNSTMPGLPGMGGVGNPMGALTSVLSSITGSLGSLGEMFRMG